MTAAVPHKVNGMRAIRHLAASVLTGFLLAACSTSGQSASTTGTDDAGGPPHTFPFPLSAASATGGDGSGSPSDGSPSPSVPAPTPTPTPTSPEPVDAPATPVPLPTAFVPLDQVIRDPDLGHEIKALRLARNLPWPAAQADEGRSLELVGVEMTWTPGTTYTATLRIVDFSLGTSSAYPNRPDAILNSSLLAAGWSLLPPEVPTGQSSTGWVVFRVEPKDVPALRLDYTRPASRVTDSGQVFPKTVFSAQLVG